MFDEYSYNGEDSTKSGRELLDSTDEEYENSNIRYYIKDLYERLTDLLDYSSIRDITEDDYERIETSFHSVLNNIEIEGYERHINI